MAEHAPSHRTIVKVCGITRHEDARAAVEAGANWLGFIVHGESPRRIDAAAAHDIAAAFPDATAVAVMVAPPPHVALDLARRIGAQRIQLHRCDPAAWEDGFPLPIAFAVPVTSEGTLAGRLPSVRDLLMLDAAHETAAGGTGRTFPWESAVVLAARRPVMLAGGLGPDNVIQALERVRPWGVDASSRLESAPGLKDAGLVRRFVAAVRTYDARLEATP